jgi:RecB family exonuclease
LRRPDPLEAAYSPADVGTLAHRVMQRWLHPGGPGWEALARGDGPAAEAQLRAAALQVAGRQDTGDPAARSVAVQQQLPGAAVALQSLLCLAPDLVAIELERAGAWQPAVLEGEFSLTVAEAARWLDEADPGAPALIIPDAHREVRLTGSIDRIDRRRDGAAQAAVIDYKTGVLPSKASISDGRLLQLHLYALAVEVGAVRELTAPPGSAWRLDHAGFYGLRRQGLGLPTQPHLTSGADFIMGVRTILQQVLAILDPRSPYALVPDWQAEQGSGQLPCRTCEFRGVCRLEERDHGPALAARLAALLTESPRGVS